MARLCWIDVYGMSPSLPRSRSRSVRPVESTRLPVTTTRSSPAQGEPTSSRLMVWVNKFILLTLFLPNTELFSASISAHDNKKRILLKNVVKFLIFFPCMTFYNFLLSISVLYGPVYSLPFVNFSGPSTGVNHGKQIQFVVFRMGIDIWNFFFFNSLS